MGFKPRASSSLRRAGQLYGIDLSRGVWAAAQIVSVDAGELRLAGLNWFGDTCPTVAALRGRPLLVHDHHSWGPTLITRGIDDHALPADYALLGQGPPAAGHGGIARGNKAGHFELQLRAQGRWLRIPKVMRDACKVARTRLQQNIKIVLGPGAPTNVISAGRTQVHVVGPVNNGPSPITLVGPDSDVNWQALDSLRALSDVSYRGDDVGLIAYLEAKPMIAQLFWSTDEIEALDLRRTHLTSVGAYGARLRRISLPRECETLRLSTSQAALQIVAADGGAGIALTVSELSKPLRTIAGIPRIRKLTLNRADELDCAELQCFPELEHIDLHKVTRLRSVRRLTQLGKLKRLDVYQCYDFDGEHFPIPAAWPDFAWMSIDGCRKTDALALKQRNSKDKRLQLRGAKTDVWLKANVSNPFRDWSDHHTGRKAKTASKAYADAVKAIAASEMDVDTILRNFVDVFNAMDEKDGVDTADREDIWDAFALLLAEAAADESRYEQLFDDWRDF